LSEAEDTVNLSSGVWCHGKKVDDVVTGSPLSSSGMVVGDVPDVTGLKYCA
jgi:hypothetical protein